MGLGSSLRSLGVLGLTLASCGDGNYRLGSGRAGSPAASPGNSGQGGGAGVDVDGGSGTTGSGGVGATSTGGTGGDPNSGGSAGGSDVDAMSDVPNVPDAMEDRSSDASAGSGGSGGTAGSGGSGGTSGSGGRAGADQNRWPGVGCLNQTCAPAEVCCLASYPGFPTPPPVSAFRCAVPGATCEYTLQCDGDHDCPAGQQCCVAQTAGGRVARCAASCVNPSYHVECTKPEHCGDGLACCGTNFQPNRFDSFSCLPSCNGFNDQLACSVEEDCPSSATCGASAVLPGIKTCMP
jgi:hypothetical protein